MRWLVKAGMVFLSKGGLSSAARAAPTWDRVISAGAQRPRQTGLASMPFSGLRGLNGAGLIATRTIEEDVQHHGGNRRQQDAGFKQWVQ